jgi:hypothetical protein
MCLQRFDVAAAFNALLFRIAAGHAAVQLDTASRSFNLFRAISFPPT